MSLNEILKDANAYPLKPSAIRRLISVGMLFLLGILLIYIAATSSLMAFGYKMFLLALGGGALWLGQRTRVATLRQIELRADGLFQDDGFVLCTFDEIEKVERGPFAFKPSNGFVVVLKEKAPRGWAPGLWWRFGRRIGVGGVTPAGAGKAMADVLAARVAGMGALD